MKKIDLEAHFVTEEYIGYLRRRREFPKLETIEDEEHRVLDRLWFGTDLCRMRSLAMRNRLLNIGEERIREMDTGGIDRQVLSLDPGCEFFDAADGVPLVRNINDELARAIKRNPKRFIGLATLAPQSPREAADELERAVKELGFSGAKLNSNVKGEYLDDQKYWPIFEKAEKLEVPIYLHPMVPAEPIVKPYTGYGGSLAGPSLGFGAETAVHVMLLIYSGVFDQYPGLKIILGHLGEGLPFWLPRLDLGWLEPHRSEEKRPKCLKRPSEYIKNNFVVTTSGMFFQPAFLCTYLALGADNIAFAVDYPYAENDSASQFIEKFPVCDADKVKICYSNTERLLNLSRSLN
jgi:predicted TIM-barrel fold metal-dependent hydrolase